ncbi:MAG: hypothetical protein ABSG96_20025 [Terracidiphilus sp.]|jgi:hypothetical protein
MPRDKKSSCGCTAWVLTDEARGAVIEGLPSPITGDEDVKALPSGITAPRFEAKQRAAEIVARLTLPEKISQLSCPIQVIAEHNANHNTYSRGDRTMSYATAHIAACCSGNVNRIML